MEYININVIMDRLNRHPLLSDITLETVVDYAVEFMRVLGVSPSFINKIAVIPITDFRGKLPCDYYSMIGVRTMKKPPIYLRYTTDKFHLAPRPGGELTYKLQGQCIFVNIPETKLEISYNAIPIDVDGYPLIPDDATYTRALEAYIKLKWFTIQFDLGKITMQAFQNAQQDYAFAVGQAQSRLILPNPDQMEALSNLWSKWLPDTDRNFQRGFKEAGNTEHIKIH